MRAWLCVPLVLLACARPEPAAPRPLRVVPSSGAVGASVPVIIEGDGLEPVVRTYFNEPQDSVIDPAFTATLGGVALEQVTARADGTLSAVIPAKLSLGSHELVVVSPEGVEGRLPQAFRVVTTFDSVARFQFEPVGDQRAKVPFGIGIAALDAQGRIVEGFEGDVTLAPSAGAITPTALGPFRTGRLRGVLVTVNEPVAGLTLTVTDGSGHSGSSESFNVSSGPPQRLELQGPARTTAGDCVGPFTLAVRDSAGNLAPSASDATVALTFGPPEGAAAFADASCASSISSVLLPAGTASGSLFLELTRAGSVQLRAALMDLPAALQTIDVDAAAPARLAFFSPSWSVAMGGCSSAIRFGLTDEFGNAVAPAAPVAVTVSVGPSNGASLFADGACGTAATGAVTLDASTPEATLHARGDAAGSVELSLTAPSLQPAAQLDNVTP